MISKGDILTGSGNFSGVATEKRVQILLNAGLGLSLDNSPPDAVTEPSKKRKIDHIFSSAKFYKTDVEDNYAVSTHNPLAARLES